MYEKIKATNEIVLIDSTESQGKGKGDMDKLTMDRVFGTLEAMKFAKIIHKPQADDVLKVLDLR